MTYLNHATAHNCGRLRALRDAQRSTVELEDVLLPEGGAAEEPKESFQSVKARLIEQLDCNYITGLSAANHRNINNAAPAAKKNPRAFFQLVRKYGITAQV